MTMGTAEAIAIKMITTANIFAISFRLWPGKGRSLLFNRRSLAAAAILMISVLRLR
jgi:hypothetical protein